MPISAELERWRESGDFFPTGDGRLFYRLDGAGEPLLLLHGFPTSSFDWHRIWEDLSGRFRVLAPDFLGYGFSDKPADHPYRVADHTDQVEALMAELGIGKAAVLAHDYGDTVAQELLARRLEGAGGFEISSVCFLNGGLLPGVHRPTFILKLLNSPLGFACSALMTRGIFRRRFSEIFAPDSRPSEQDITDYWALVNYNGGRRIYHKLVRYMRERWQHRDRWVGALERTPVPLALIDGAADPISGEHLVEPFRQVCPRAKVVCLEGVGHYPQLEAPRRVVEGFLESMVARHSRP